VVAAYVLVQAEVGKAAEVAKEVVQIEGVQQAEDVVGPYDVIVRAEARNLDELGKLVVARVQAVDGITRTSPVRWCTSSAARSPSGIWPTATAAATRVDRGGRRRAAASEASRSQTPTNGCDLGNRV
jgi:AsnC-like helix-turn-helix protein